ncbi:MAG: AAA family ATPase [Bacteroidetes bacterium]|nr:AAA family ATPase [Bacteroidota bacterium]
MTNVRFPYGISDFGIVAEEGYLYLDRTRFLAHLDQLNTRYHSFLRPRRFGKSLSVSIMEHYYGKAHKDNFQRLFGQYYIGQHPTPRANAYLVLKLDFSGVETSRPEDVYKHFLSKVKDGIIETMRTYPEIYAAEDRERIRQAEYPSLALQAFISITKAHKGEKLFVLIDEYDHFTNEIIAFNYDDFKAIVSQNGFVRKFYEVLKQGTGAGVVDRIFITGVSPVTLDSLTSGYNIGTDLTLDFNMHDFMGFTEAETASLLQMAGVPEGELPGVMADVRAWYNGYRFNSEVDHQLYNPDMVLYFAAAFAQYGKYPTKLLDANVASDYGKIRRMLRVGDKERNYQLLEEVLQQESVREPITELFSFEKQWTRGDFASLLFYLGLLTIKGSELGFMDFHVPNYVIKGLYYDFFQQVLLQRAALQADELRLNQRIASLALENDMHPLAEALETVLQRLDNRDARGFNEKAVKIALLSLLVPAGVYAVYSEYAIGQGYADVALFRRPPILQPKCQHLIELKYLQKSERSKLEEKADEGRTQLKRYLNHEDIAQHGDFKAWLMVVVGYEVVLLEEVLP